MWDFRERNKVCSLQSNGKVTCVKCDPSGLLIAIGNRACLDMYDVRFDRKLFSIKASYPEPINSINFLENNTKSILFSNSKQIKITDREGKFFTNIEPDNPINKFTIVPQTGMILAAL
jgi:hypothetical protein